MWHVVGVSSLLPSTACTAAKAASNSSVLTVVHRHGPCSPLRSRRGPPPSHAEILRRSQDRVVAIHRRVAGASPISTAHASKPDGGVSLPVRWGAPLGDNNYIVTVGLGTPARLFSVELDTGSDLSWVQCKPCRGCYKQRDALFDPARSSTFAAVPCGAPACRDFAYTQTCSADGECPYAFPYADGSQTVGDLVRDTLTLAAPSKTLPGFVFGCGHADTGTFGEADGPFGLGRDKVGTKYGARFSYCLPSSSSAAGYLSLGGAAPANTQFTAMVTRTDTDMPSLYYVNLVGIKVAGKDLNIPPAAFLRGGTIIDSGTVVTYIPPRAYAALRSAFTRSMGSYKRAPALDDFDTCYDFTGVTMVKVLPVALVFADGAVVNLDARGVLYVSSVSQTCLAFASNGDESYGSILGNTQQKTFTVVYDVASQKIGFSPNGCS